MKLRAVVIAGSCCYFLVTDADIISSCDDVQSDRLLSVISSFRHTCHHIVSCSNRSLAAYQQELQQQQQVMLVILT